MANKTICKVLKGSIDQSCSSFFTKKYYQEIVLINAHDIDRESSRVGNSEGESCDYTVEMILRAATKGVMIKLPDSNKSIKGFFDKSRDDYGDVQYLHKVQIMIKGIDKETKCKLDKLDKGRYVAALQGTDGMVEIYGWGNGLSTSDYTFDITEGGGGSLIVLQSDETAQENLLPLVYKPQSGGDANADFNSQFEQP